MFEFQQEWRGRHLLQPRWSLWGSGCHPPRVLLCSAPSPGLSTGHDLCSAGWSPELRPSVAPAPQGHLPALPSRVCPPGICLGTSPEPVSAWATFLSEGLAPTPTPHPRAHQEGGSFWGLQSPGSHPPAQVHRDLVADLGLLGLQGGVRAATHPSCTGWCAKTSLSPFQEGCSQLPRAGAGLWGSPSAPQRWPLNTSFHIGSSLPDVWGRRSFLLIICHGQ